MKKIIPIIILGVLATACSSDDNINKPEEQSVAVKNFIFKTFDLSTIPISVIDSINFSVDNNRISSYSGISLKTNTASSGIYSYSNNKIVEISDFRQGELIRRRNYSYDNQGNLIEYIQKTINSFSNQDTYNKQTFVYARDTIFGRWVRGMDGINFDTAIADFKIVLDDDMNRLYFERFDYLNNQTDIVLNTYDNNSNAVKQEIFNNGRETLTFEMTYDNSKNTLYMINAKTFSKKTLMLLYHTQSSAINNFNPRIISPNTLITFNANFSDEFTYEISNIVNDNTFSEVNEFKTLLNNEIFTFFSYQYIFDE